MIIRVKSHKKVFKVLCDKTDGERMLEIPVSTLRRLHNTGMLRMPMNKDGNYDFQAMDKVYMKMGMAPWYGIHGWS